MPSEKLPRQIVNQLLRVAQAASDFEVCGLIAASGGRPSRVYPVANAADQPRCRFDMDAAEQIGAMRQMRERGETLWAIYHSHPDAPPTPSPSDLAEHAYPHALYLIISLDTKGVLQLRGFRRLGDGMQPVALEI